MKRHIAAAAVLFAATAFAQEEQSDPAANRNFLKVLAGSAGVAEFITENFADGRPAITTIGQDENGKPVFHAVGGKLLIDSEKLFLRCNDLTFNAGTEQLVAVGDPDRVEIRAEGMEADCARLEYFLSTGDILLTDTGPVSQETPENSVRFEGMDVFRASQGEDGGRTVKLEGPDTITVAVSAREGGEGFAGLGDQVTIETRPYRTEAPDVGAELTPENDLARFRAKGDVKVTSESFSLLSEELIYNAVEGLMEANGRIFLKRDDIEAECGRLVYDEATGKISLSVLPVIRQRDADGVTVYYNYDSITYLFSEGDIPDADFRGPGGIKYQQIPKDATGTAPAPPEPSREIVIPD